MAPSPQTVRLPDGQTFSVTPVFGGVSFKSHEATSHLPMGWTIVLRTQEDEDEDDEADGEHRHEHKPTERPSHGFGEPTLHNDTIFISSLSIPSSAEFKAPASPTRQVAMMLWVSLYWYFHQRAPSPHVTSRESRGTPEAGRPRGEWTIHVKRDGVLRGRNVLPKLERMGLVASGDSSVGLDADDTGESWRDMYVSRRMFWQTPGRLFLFTLARNNAGSSSSFAGSPASSRPGSPEPAHGHGHGHGHHWRALDGERPSSPMPSPMVTPANQTPNQYVSTSHLPTYYPPAPCQYVMTGGVRHPLRPKPPRMGETFYSRFVPSVGQYLAFRVASSSPHAVPYLGPVGPSPPPAGDTAHLRHLSDTELLRAWMAKPRVAKFWGPYTEGFLEGNLQSRHAFPVIGMWDGVPFGYFEIYWVKEDILGRHMGGGEADDWERGFHVFVGEEWALGRLRWWSSALVHWCLAADYRTMRVCLEPRVDNERFVDSLVRTGFSRERQIAFPHKQSWLVRYRRDVWEGPYL